MANRFPLILNTSSNQIQEIASGDQLDLTGNNIANAGIITASTVNVTGDLDVDGHINLDNVSVSGVLTATTFSGDGSGLIGVASTDNIVTGTAATFTGGVDINSDLDVDGHTNLDNVSIAGVTTMSGNLTISNTLPSLFLTDTNNNDDYSIQNQNGYFAIKDESDGHNRLVIHPDGKNVIGGDLDVDGHTNLDNVSIAGVTTFTGAVTTGDHVTLSGQNPHITFTDTNHNPDFEIYGSAGNFKIWDSTSNVGRLIVNSDGHVDIPGNLDCGAGLDVTGNVIASGNVTAVDATFSGNVSVGGTLTYEDVTNIDSVGLITARTGIRVSANGDLRFANGTWSGEVAGKIQQNSNKLYIQSGTSGTQIRRSDGQASWEWNNNGHFIPGLDSNVNIGENAKRVANIYADTLYGDGSNLTGISVGISTNAQTVTNGNTLLLDLTKDDHKVTATGTVTISCTGGTEGDSHTVRIVNSGITTVGFSTYFLFPSGGAPNIPITSGTISLISFTVHRAGAVGVSTQLLSGASVSFA